MWMGNASPKEVASTETSFCMNYIFKILNNWKENKILKLQLFERRKPRAHLFHVIEFLKIFRLEFLKVVKMEETKVNIKNDQ